VTRISADCAKNLAPKLTGLNHPCVGYRMRSARPKHAHSDHCGYWPSASSSPCGGFIRTGRCSASSISHPGTEAAPRDLESAAESLIVGVDCVRRPTNSSPRPGNFSKRAPARSPARSHSRQPAGGRLLVDARTASCSPTKPSRRSFPREKHPPPAARARPAQRRVSSLCRRGAGGQAAPQHELEFVEGDRSIWAEVTGTLVTRSMATPVPGTFCSSRYFPTEKLEAIRKDFVANVSHELRTRSASSRLRRNAGGRAPRYAARRSRPFSPHDPTARRAAPLPAGGSAGALTFGVVNPGLHRESTVLADLLTTWSKMSADVPPRRSIRFRWRSTRRSAWCSSIRSNHQVCENLLDNALKYTRADRTSTSRRA